MLEMHVSNNFQNGLQIRFCFHISTGIQGYKVYSGMYPLSNDIAATKKDMRYARSSQLFILLYLIWKSLNSNHLDFPNDIPKNRLGSNCAELHNIGTAESFGLLCSEGSERVLDDPGDGNRICFLYSRIWVPEWQWYLNWIVEGDFEVYRS
jgi:hypothetical protein